MYDTTMFEGKVIDDAITICPICKRILRGVYVEKDGRVFLSRECPYHGHFTALVSSNYSWYMNSFQFNKPGKRYLIKYYASGVKNGCPWDCGICPAHEQHTCLALIEVTNRCNLECPVCYVDANKISANEPKIDEIIEMINFIRKCEESPPSLNITGGEPTIRDDLLDIIGEAISRGFKNITISTNGIMLAKDRKLPQKLAEVGNVTINISFDSLSNSAYNYMRGSLLLDVKKLAIKNCKEAGLNVSLSVTIIKGINESEIGKIIKFAINSGVSGINFTPLAYIGRFPLELADPMDRLTIADVAFLIEGKTGGRIKLSDFFTVPCPDNRCSMMTYVIITEDDLIPIGRIFDVKPFLNTSFYGEEIDKSEVLKIITDKLLSMGAIPGSEDVNESISRILPECNCENIKVKGLLSINIHGFQDPWTIDIKRCKKCCVHIVTREQKLIPFCIYNIFYRNRKDSTVTSKLG